jgi:site-specific recombinase XerD
MATYIEGLQAKLTAPSVKKGKTPVMDAGEAKTLFNVIDDTSVVGLRDRALMAVMTYTFSRVGVCRIRVEDVYVQGRRMWFRLHEMPCHQQLEEYLHAYTEAAGIASDLKGYLLRTANGRTGTLTEKQMTQADVYRRIRRHAADASLKTRIGCHSFRATGNTEHLKNGGKLEIAQQMANHASARTIGLYDCRTD